MEGNGDDADDFYSLLDTGDLDKDDVLCGINDCAAANGGDKKGDEDEEGGGGVDKVGADIIEWY